MNCDGRAADDFGHLVHHAPRTVLAPGSAAEVAAALTAAAAAGRPVAARGRGHSVFGRAQAAGGVVLDLARLRAVHPVAGRPEVVAGAGATWSDVLAVTLPRGLTPPVLPGYLDLSVGGTVAVGGVGATTWREGCVADHVVAVGVVTGAGEELTCSPGRLPELFDAVRAGLGQVAVITRVALRLVPAPERVRRCTLSYPDLATLLADQRLLAADGRCDGLQGAAVPTPDGWAFRLEATGPVGDDAALLAGLADHRPDAALATVAFLDDLRRLDALEGLLRSTGRWSHPHPWLTAFVPDDGAERVVEAELAALGPDDLGPLGQVVLAPVLRRPVTAPLLRLPAGDRSFALNLIRLPAPADADRLVRANREAYDRVRAAGGVLYPASAALSLTPADWRAHFGPARDAFAAARRRHDPAGVLTPGWGVF